MRDAVQDRGLLAALQMAVDHRESTVDQAWDRYLECPERDESLCRAIIRHEYVKLQWCLARRDKAMANARGELHLRVVR